MSRPVPSTRRDDQAGIVLAYIGDEQPSWGRTAFPAPRHYYVMPAILYLQASLRAAGRTDVRTVFLNRSVQSFDEMVAQVAAGAPRAVGLSCYSWNIADMLALAAALGDGPARPAVVVGGPEVAFADPLDALRLLEAQPALDAVVLGEGEAVVAEVIDVLVGARPPAPVGGAVLRAGGEIIVGPREAPPVDLAALPDIEPADVEVPLGPGAGVAVVYQTYRGCPYSCAYCSFHGGSHGIRSFPLERVERELGTLLAARVPCIHFADSVFDRRSSRAKRILSYCLEHNRETSLFCYAAFQKLDTELAELLERTRIQVGVGLQSVDERVLERVGRRFDVARFEESLALIVGRRVNWYVDVMFGLPGDDLSGFRRTIDRVAELGPTFVMPFPLTVIPRTALAADLDGYEVVRYDDERVRERVRPISGMVYENVGLFRAIDLDDLARFDDVATAIFVAVQRFPRTVRMLVGDRSAFDVLELIGKRIKERLGGMEIDPANPPLVDGAIHEAVAAIMAEHDAAPIEVEALAALMRIEVAIDLMLRRTDRRGFYRRALERAGRRAEPADLDGREAADLTVAFAVENGLYRCPFPYDDLLRLGDLQGRIERRETQLALLAPFDHFEVGVFELGGAERLLCDVVPTGREVALARVLRRAERGAERDVCLAALRRLTDIGLLGIYRPG